MGRRTIQLYSFSSATKLMMAVLLAVLLLFSSGFSEEAHAAGKNGALCDDLSGAPVQGFSVAIIYCVRATIRDALLGTDTSGLIHFSKGGYLQQVVTFLNPYKWAAITLAFTLYGVKLMTVSVEQLTKESFTLLFKAVMVLFLFDNLAGAQVYTSPGGGSGLYVALSDAADSLVAFATDGIVQYTCKNPPAVPVGANANAYKVWQEFDCMFQTLMSAGSNPKDVALGVGVAVVVILGAALFSGVFALFLIMMAITLFVMVLLTLMRAIYALILSYFVLALLVLCGPIIIPLLVFDNKYTTEMFWKWLGLISSVIFQPLFLVGFMCFAIMAETAFVDGNASNAGGAFASCVPGGRWQKDEVHPTADKPGSGVCSISQLLNSCRMDPFCVTYGQGYGEDSKGNLILPPHYCCIIMERLFYLHLNVSLQPPAQNACDSWPWWSRWACNIGKAVLTAIVDVINWAWDQVEKIVNNILDKIVIWVPMLQFPIKQFFVTIVALIITTIVFRDLLDVIPNMAQGISVSVGIGLLQMAQVPLEGIIANATKGAGDAMKSQMHSMKGQGGFKRAGSMGKVGMEGIKGAGKAITDKLFQ